MKRWGQGGEEVKATHSEPDEKEEAKTKRGRQAHKHIPLQTEEESGRSSAGLSSFITPNKSVCNPTTDLYSSRGEGNNGGGGEWSAGKLISCNAALPPH